MDRSTPASLIAERSVLEAFLALALSSIDPCTDEGLDDTVRRILAPDHQRGLDEGVTFNSGI